MAIVQISCFANKILRCTQNDSFSVCCVLRTLFTVWYQRSIVFANVHHRVCLSSSNSAAILRQLQWCKSRRENLNIL